MGRTTTVLLTLFSVALTNCGPTPTDVTSMVAAGSAKTYDDAL